MVGKKLKEIPVVLKDVSKLLDCLRSVNIKVKDVP